MAEINRQSFEVVRRGYDIDQVDEFLVRQAEAWRTELYDARKRISELEADVVGMHQLESEVEQARRQQEALTMTLQTAAQARDEMLAKAEHDAEVLRSETKQDIETDLSEAKATAAELVANAEQEAADIRHQSRMRTDELMIAQEEELAKRRQELEATHDDAAGRYRQVEQTLATKVRDLNSMREALVAGLEAIATGGLSALEEVGDVLAEVGIVNNDDTAVRELLESVDDEATTEVKAQAGVDLDVDGNAAATPRADDHVDAHADSDAVTEADVDGDFDADADLPDDMETALDGAADVTADLEAEALGSTA